MKNCRSIRFVTCFVALSVMAWGQGQDRGGSGSSTGTGGQSGSSSGGRTSGTQGNQNQNQGTFGNNRQTDPFGNRNQDPFANQARPLYLSGKVLTTDGTPPSEPVTIKRVCTGSTYPEGYTDSKGRFSFQVGGDMSMLTTDASVAGSGIGPGTMMGGSYTREGIRQLGMGRYDLGACVLRAELTGYRSQDIQLGVYSVMGKNDVGVIVVERLDGIVGDTVSVLTLQAPKAAQKAYQSGLREMRKSKPNLTKAVNQFQKAVGQYPQFAAAWAAMGDAKVRLNDRQGAIDAFSESVKQDPNYMKPYEPMIEIATQMQNWTLLESLGTKYLELNPNATNVRFVTAIAALNSGQHDKAEEMVMALRVGEGANRYPQGYQIMALIHEQRAEFEKAADQYRAFIRVGDEGSTSVQQAKRKLHEWEMLGVIPKASP